MMITRVRVRRRVRVLAAGFGVLLLLSACGLVRGDLSGQGGGELTFWHAFTGGAERGAIDEIIRAYNEQHPELPVRDRGISNEEHFTVVRTGLSGSSPPEVVHFEGYQQTRDFAAAGQLLDLTDLWQEHQDQFLLPDSARRACTYEGRVYCIPYTFHSGWQIYYNEQLLSEQGIAAPRTWDEFTAASATLQAAGVTPIAIGARDGWPAEHWWMAFVVQRCGVAHVYEVIDGKGARFTDDCFLRAAEDLAAVAAVGYFSVGAASDDYGASISVFRSGQAAFLQTGSWFVAELQNQPADFTVGVIPFPRLADAEHTGDITGAVTHVFGISSRAAHQEAARAFLEHLLTEQSTTTWAERGLPSLVVGAVAEHGPQEIKTIFQAVLDAEASLPWLENELPPGVGEDRIYNGTAALVAGRMAPADFVASVQAGLEAR